MRNINEISDLKLQVLSCEELKQISGGWEWLDKAAFAIGWVVGKTTHAVIDAFLVVTGNYEMH